MSADRSDEIARLAAANWFRVQRADLQSHLRGLIGPRVAFEVLTDSTRAAAVAEEFRTGLRAAELNDWAFVVREWTTDAIGSVSHVLHRIRDTLGPRSVWVSWGQREPQAAALNSDVVLDNPVGFASLADHELRLHDREVPAGLWLGRHSYHYVPNRTEYSWELYVWGEPWLSAATRAIRETD